MLYLAMPFYVRFSLLPVCHEVSRLSHILLPLQCSALLPAKGSGAGFWTDTSEAICLSKPLLFFSYALLTGMRSLAPFQRGSVRNLLSSSGGNIVTVHCLLLKETSQCSSLVLVDTTSQQTSHSSGSYKLSDPPSVMFSE